MSWLESLKVGDEVMMPGRYGGAPSIFKIDRMTATQIVVGHHKFRRTNGLEIGCDTWSSTSIVEPTQAGKDAAEALRLRSRIAEIAKRESTPLEILRAMLKVTQP